MALTTINDAVLRVGELLIPIVELMKRDLLTGDYIQADETYVECRLRTKRARTTGYFWQYSAPGKGVVFDFEMTRSKEVPKDFFKDYGGILHTDGYVAYEKDIGTEEYDSRLLHGALKAQIYRGHQGANQGPCRRREVGTCCCAHG